MTTDYCLYIDFQPNKKASAGKICKWAEKNNIEIDHWNTVLDLNENISIVTKGYNFYLYNEEDMVAMKLRWA